MSNDLFYMQDSRKYVGNDVLFHCINGQGYTTDLRKAAVFSKEQAIHMHHVRSTDIPWPKSYIDEKTRPAVDMQYINTNDALADTGIELTKPKKVPKPRCTECGSFADKAWPYIPCKKCGATA
jgi:hypothetical protein